MNINEQHIVDVVKAHPWCPEIVISKNEDSCWIWNPVCLNNKLAPVILIRRDDLQVDAVFSLLEKRVLYVFGLEHDPFGSSDFWRALRLSDHHAYANEGADSHAE